MSFLDQLSSGVLPRIALELFASLLGLMYLLLIAQKRANAWLVGTLSCGIFAGLCFESRLVYQGIIQIINVILGCYAWLHWKKGIKSVRSIPRISFLSIVFFPMLLLLSRVIQQSTVISSLTTSEDWAVSLDQVALVYSVVATYLTFRLIVENWHLWLLVNMVTTYTAWVNGLSFYAGMSLIYALISVFGLLKWKRS
jgi:nicotinamide mononucleotide transporter